MSLPIKSEWLADLLMGYRDMITQCWIEDIRDEHIRGYDNFTDEQLREELPPTVDSMIEAFRTGDTEGPRQHSIGVIRQRLKDGLELPDLQMSLHALETAVMRIVRNANLGVEKEFEALQAASTMYYLVALIAAAVYEQLRIEQQRRFTATYEFGVELSQSLDLDAILDIVIHKVAEYFSADSVAVLLAGADGEPDELRAQYNLDDELAAVLPEISRSMHCGTTNAGSLDIRENTRVIPDVRECEQLARWMHLFISSNRSSVSCVPLVVNQRRIGSLAIFWSEVHVSTNDEVNFLLAMAGHMANAVENAILYEEAKGKRELGILLRSSRLFASSLDMQDVLNKIARMAAKAVQADLSVVYTRISMHQPPDIGYQIRSKAAKGAEQILHALVAEWEEHGFGSLGSEFADGKPRRYRSLKELPRRVRPMAGVGGSMVVVPLRRKNVLLGACAMVSLTRNAFTESDLVLVGGLADLAAVAIENARLYEYERNIAKTLQGSFLPSSLPCIEGYEVAAYYRPAMAEAEIGGDFYDVFATGDGSTSLVIGDVSGKGLKAAIPTAMSRYIIRAFAAENPLPSSVLKRFNRAFYENAPEGLFMTAFYGSLNPVDNILTYVSAGHEPPLLYHAESGRIAEIYADGLCIGVLRDVECVDRSMHLETGDVLLLYTDGATDAKGEFGRLGPEGLRQVFESSLNGSADEIVKRVSDAIWEYAHGVLSDDIALLVLRRLGELDAYADEC